MATPPGGRPPIGLEPSGDPDPAGFAAALEEEGIVARIEPRDTLVLLVTDLRTMSDPEVRALVVTLARAYGFSHVALELT